MGGRLRQTVLCARAEACSCLGAELLKISKLHVPVMPRAPYSTSLMFIMPGN